MADHTHPPASPPALRLHRPGWRDPRLLLGVVLVAASVALGSTLVSAAGRTVPVFAAADALVPGDVLDADDLTVREVRLDAVGTTYVRADEPLADGLVAIRVVGAGELLPRSAVATRTELDVRPVAIEPDGALPDGLAAGASVDLWFVPEESTPAATASSVGSVREVSQTEPALLAAGLTVAEVSEPRSGLTVGSTPTVHVLVPVDELATVLGALAAEGTVEVVLVPGGGR